MLYTPDYIPVDDAMPERLPQARLTITVESFGLIHDEDVNIGIKQSIDDMDDQNIKENSPLRKPVGSKSLIDRKADSYTRSYSLHHASSSMSIEVMEWVQQRL